VVDEQPAALDIGVLNMARKLRLTTFAVASCGLAMLSWKPLVDPVPWIMWNTSDSVSKGLYWVEHRAPRIDEIAVLKPPVWASAIADQRGYLPKNAWLMKPVVATTGPVCRFGNSVFFDGFFVAKALKHDKFGRALPVWKGCELLRANEVFLLSQHRDSFDSRYFGAVSTDLIVGTAQPLIVLGK
jgi:conjugative transfer signal peptidase TraF